MRLFNKKFWSSFLRGMGSLSLFPPRLPPLDFHVLTAEEINRRAWRMTGDSLRKAMKDFERNMK